MGPGPVQPPWTRSVLVGRLDQIIFIFYGSVQICIKVTVQKSFKYHVRELNNKGSKVVHFHIAAITARR